jgi:hypothetical protein
LYARRVREAYLRIASTMLLQKFRRKKMQNKNMKYVKQTIAIVIITFLAFSTILQLAAAQDAEKRVTYAYIGATPNPVGVNQETLLHIGITQQYMSMYEGWKGLTVTVTDPDGVVTTLGPFNTDPTGGTGSIFVPTKIGNYTLQTHFPEQINGIAIPAGFGNPLPKGTIMLASNSRNLTLTVQQDPTPIYQEHALPTEYWSRPIDSQLHAWTVLAGNWQRSPSNLVTQGNLDAPETAHILWAKPLQLGGVVGAELGDKSWTTGDAYQGQFMNSVILNGVLYYNMYEVSDAKAANPIQGIKALDLRTGEEIWTRNGSRLAFGQLLYVDTMNMHGAYGYIWSTDGSTWTAFDATTGDYVYKIVGVPSGVTVIGPNNEILIYTVNNKGWMTCWNSTTVVNQGHWNNATQSWDWEFGRYWNPHGIVPTMNSTFDAANGYMWNVSVPAGLSGAAYAKINDKLVGQTIIGLKYVNTWAVDLNKGREGHLLYNETWNAPSDWFDGYQTISRIAGSIDDGLIAVWSKETQQVWGFSTDTGKYIWGPMQPQFYLDMFGIQSLITDGKLFTLGMSGILYAYEAKTGKLLWTYTADDPYNQNLWANQWNIRPLFVADGKLYMGTAEHSPVDPRPRGAAFTAVNITDGAEIFRADGLFRQTEWGGRAIIGDSIIAALDTYDQRIYAIGKGPTALEVNAPDVSVEYGKTVVIRGSVTDISAGTNDYAIAARFPNGVPAVSDESQTPWMLYVYKNFERPSNATGVTIELSVVDANGNYRSIGTTTSDADGFFNYNWKPDIEGAYILYASFAGSKAYWPSHAVTSFAVDPAAATPTSQPVITQEPVATYIAGAAVAIIIAIAVIGALLAVMIRKRP